MSTTTTVWVYAKDEVEAIRNANGEDFYEPWDDRQAAINDANRFPDCKDADDILFRVVSTVAVFQEE